MTGLTLRAVADDLWTVDAEPVRFFTFPYALRMTIIRLADGSLFLHSPTQLGDPLRSELAALGPVQHIVSPNKLHHLYLADWGAAYPKADLYAPPRLSAKRKDVRFTKELTDAPEPAWRLDIDQHVVRGSWFMEEVVFFHRSSRTLILGDLIENHDPELFSPVQRWIARRNRMFGETPVNYRWSFRDRVKARAGVERMLAWEPHRVIVMHGRCIDEDVDAFLRTAFGWVL